VNFREMQKEARKIYVQLGAGAALEYVKAWHDVNKPALLCPNAKYPSRRFEGDNYPYATQYALALQWLGDRYLLAKPINRKTENV
jgi:hypothetical protein